MKENNLIFLISLPRSGSTMLQKMLGTHSDVYTRSEPWMMLHPLSFFREDAIKADYNHPLAIKAFEDFLSLDCESLTGGQELYFESQKLSAIYLYEKQLEGKKESFFLDKTPRYFKVFDELIKVFPESKFIILHRNPIAVLSSIIHTWIDDDVKNLSEFKDDLTSGIDFLARDFSSYENVCSVTYENLVENSKPELSRLQKFIGLQEDVANVVYDNSSKWRYGDQDNVYQKSKPDPDYATNWISRLEDPYIYSLCEEFLQSIGPEKFSQIGYSYDDAETVLDTVKPLVSSDEKKFLSLSELFMSDENKIKLENNHLAEVNRELETRISKYESESKQLQLRNHALVEKYSRLETHHDELKSAYESSTAKSSKWLSDLKESLSKNKSLMTSLIESEKSRKELISYFEEIKAKRDVLSRELEKTKLIVDSKKTESY